MGILLSTSISVATRPADFGEQWVRNNPFTITALVNNNSALGFEPGQFKGAGFNTTLLWERHPVVLTNGAKADIPWMYHVQSDADFTEILNTYNTDPNGLCLIFDYLEETISLGWGDHFTIPNRFQSR